VALAETTVCPTARLHSRPAADHRQRTGGASMIHEHARFRIVVDQADDFQRAFTESAHHLLDSGGCLSVELLRSVDHSHTFLMRVAWRSLQDHLDGFNGSGAASAFAAELGRFLAGAPEVIHFESAPVVSLIATDGSV
jgi:quinol monooxygenase YgiN